MPLEVGCPSCDAKFRVPESAAGKKIRCPKCKGAIEVPASIPDAPRDGPPIGRGSSEASTFSVIGAVEAPSKGSHVEPDAPTVFMQRPVERKKVAGAVPPSPPVQTPPPSKPPALGPWRTEEPQARVPPPAIAPEIEPVSSPADEWTLKIADGETYGPVTKAELDAWKEEGRITADCQLQQAGHEGWRPAAEVYPDIVEEQAETDELVEPAPEPVPSVPLPVPAPALPASAPHGKSLPTRTNPRRASESDEEPDYSRSSRSKAIAGILGIFLAPFGIHRFYLGYWGIGLAMLFTGGGCGIWSMVDAVMVLLGKVPDADGRPLSD
jgi:predicted Zn finger-like uncharacterized protein